ncbi:MAG: phosphatase PAP2 family protein [Acidobacteria bacterium]|nr:phosphatase PAP2 family protein [Acidobacteriota bacterium]
MRRIRVHWSIFAFIVLQFFLAAQPVPGQEESGNNPEETKFFQLFPPPAPQAQKHPAGIRFLRDIWIDQKAIWTSPFQLKSKQVVTLALPLAAATAGLIATDSRTADYLPNTRDQIRWSQRISNFGAIYTLGLLTGGMLAGGKIVHKPNYSHIGRISAEALVSSILTNYALKAITQRERPNQGSGDGKFWAGGQSFPSGHAMTSWAVAIALAHSPQCPRWLAYTSYAMATIISLSRWSAHKHFPSDILVGGVFGGLIGNYIARRPR